jgi:hypothetical protein
MVHTKGLLDRFMLPACHWVVRRSPKFLGDVNKCEVIAHGSNMANPFIKFVGDVTSAVMVASSVDLCILFVSL